MLLDRRSSKRLMYILTLLTWMIVRMRDVMKKLISIVRIGPTLRLPVLRRTWLLVPVFLVDLDVCHQDLVLGGFHDPGILHGEILGQNRHLNFIVQIRYRRERACVCITLELQCLNFGSMIHQQ